MTESYPDSYDWNQELIIRPVGYVESEITAPSLVAQEGDLAQHGHGNERHRQAREAQNIKSRIVISPDLSGILDGLADFSHALILYWPHLAKAESRKLVQVHPMGRKDIDKVGVFATCSPARPNPILATAVRVLGVEGNILEVMGLEAVDRSPVLDVKPYNRHYLEVKDLKMSDWMEEILQELGE